MKQFLIKIILLSVIVILSIGFVFSRADGHFDPFYLRFTTPKQSSLILGSSRAAQGIIPSVLEDSLNDYDFYNYCFTYNTCPFGPTYLQSIKNKLDDQSKNHMFIISVDPWTISGAELDPNDPSKFEEADLFLGKITDVNTNPNFNYLINGYTDMYVKMLYTKSPYFLHDDGWLEVSQNMDEMQYQKKLKETIANYSKKLEIFNYSAVRLGYLKETIGYLKNYGEVFLVRLPVSSEMEKLETQLIPDFDAKMREVSKIESVNYLNLIDEQDFYVYIDGHHLTKESSVLVTNKVVNFIQNIKAKKMNFNDTE